MKNSSRRQLRRLGGLAVVGAVVAAVVLVPSALSVSTSRTYSATATNSDTGLQSVAAGKNSAHFTFTITNLGSVTLDSADITPPSGFANVSVQPLTAPATSAVVGGVVQLRNLGLSGGSSVNASITADAPCTGAGNWNVTAKAANGQTFTLVGSTPSTSLTGTCTLAFTSQPNNAKFNTPITSTAYNDPPGNPVAVEALNADSPQAVANAATGQVTVDKSAGFFTSTGTGFSGNSGQLSGGSVSFPNLQSDRTGLDLQLTATATGYTSSNPSNQFDVSVDGKKCAANTCNANASGVHTSVSASGSGTNNTNLGVGLLDFSVFTIPPDVCSSGPYVPFPGANGFTEEIQTNGLAQPFYTITTIYDKFIVNEFPQNGVSALQACLLAKRIDSVTGLPRPCEQDIQDGLGGFPTINSPDPFHPFTAVCDSTTHAWGGLLPNAGPGIISCDDARLTNPVVLSRTRNSGTGPANAVLVICKPPPWDGAGSWH